ncbi:hypothetical protein M404DRAFT_113040, partial [Pisolithus tinctorius Marx 270]
LRGVDIRAAAAAFHANADAQICCAISTSLDPLQHRKPRCPRPDAFIQPSPWRPHVITSDHLISWSSPHASNFLMALEARFPHSSVLQLFRVMLQSLDVNTRSNYGAGLLRFTQFCDELSIPESAHMPASTELIALFASHHAGRLSDKTLNNWLAGLHFWHIVNGAEWKANDKLHHVRRGFTKLVPPSSKHAKRPPVTLDALCVLHDQLVLNNSFDTAVWALASVAFWCCCHLGELLIPSINAFNAVKHVSRQILPLSISQLENGTHYSSFHIPWSKTTLNVGSDISITTRNHRTCPLDALLNHCTGSLSLPSHTPLFVFRMPTGWSPMTHSWFLQRCNQIWVAAGYPDMPGHAFCIGGVTKLLLQGVPPDVVATQGHWKSQAFLEYWRQISS